MHIPPRQRLAHIPAAIAARLAVTGRDRPLVAKKQSHEDIRNRQRAWLQHVQRVTGKTLTQIAREAELTPTTLLRPMNRKDHPHAISALTISQVAQATGVAASIDIMGEAASNPPRGFREPDAAPYALLTHDPVSALIRSVIGGRNGVDPWQLKSRALETAGYLPGDIMVMDMNREAKPGDIVCAQLYDWHAPANTQTIWRLFEPPYLVAASAAPEHRRPRLVDNETIVIKAVLELMIRPQDHVR